MSETKRLEKQVQKALDVEALRRAELEDAIERFGEARAACGVAREKLEEAEALEAARELRGKK